ncbi:hypothetical protein BP00DRAFT_447019 [Aspergillus indologenus CBS 114.80]|uniref:Uncharacterized protein n=1 Tax=Aspergillus indologenus CBS 114.80 TaxID=1450541 RepID=A0A2V5I2D4_9EURO|nr:hypothetical protein BP00DRAFT_447019 [Aspergillus indologenus CBS 114.80]
MSPTFCIRWPGHSSSRIVWAAAQRLIWQFLATFNSAGGEVLNKRFSDLTVSIIPKATSSPRLKGVFVEYVEDAIGKKLLIFPVQYPVQMCQSSAT